MQPLPLPPLCRRCASPGAGPCQHPLAQTSSSSSCPVLPQALAARVRPESLPAYEVLYKTAEEIAAKREDLRRAAEAAQLKVG